MSHNDRERNGVFSRATKGIGTLVGLAVEAHAHNKNKKQSQSGMQQRGTDEYKYHANNTSHNQDQSSSVARRCPARIDSNASNRARYGPDDTNTRLHGRKSLPETERKTDAEDEATDSSLDDILPPSYDEALSTIDTHNTGPSIYSQPINIIVTNNEILPLPLTVIIPQRRPKAHTRGFIHAYPPVLLTHKQISEAQFLHFLTDFHKSTQASPILTAINIGAFAAGFAPSIIAMAVSMSVMAATKAATAVQVKYRTNNYLDKCNKKIWWKVGCHAFITTFAPGRSDERFVGVNSNRQEFQDNRRGYRQTQTQSFQLPESAPLVMIDSSAASDTTADKSSWSRSTSFVSGYLDKRAQTAHPEAYATTTGAISPTASGAKTGFASRYSDPNHPVNSGSPLDLLTGGVLNLKGDTSRGGLLAGVRDLTQGGPSSSSSSCGGKGALLERVGSNFSSRGGLDGLKEQVLAKRGNSVSGQVKGMVRKATSMQQDVLYLVIAEIPEDMRDEVTRVLRQE